MSYFVSDHSSFVKCFSSFFHFYPPNAWEMKIYCKMMWKMVHIWSTGVRTTGESPAPWTHPPHACLKWVEAWALHALQPSPLHVRSASMPRGDTPWMNLPSVHFSSPLRLCPYLSQCQLSPRLLLPFLSLISTLKSAGIFKNADLITSLHCSKFFAGFPFCLR